MDSALQTIAANQPQPENKLHFLDYWRIIRVRKTVILAFFMLVVGTTALVTWFLPPTYSSTARIEVEKDMPDVEGLQGRQFAASFDPFFITTQFEILQSKTILYDVIKRLSLNEKWAKRRNVDRLTTEETFLLLKRAMRLNQTRNTSLIEITVLIEGEDNAQEAADIANAVAEVYRDYRLSTRVDTTEKGLKALKDQLTTMEADVKAKQDLVEKYRQELKVAEIDPMNGRSTGSLDDEQLRIIARDKLEAEADYTRVFTLYSLLTNKTRAQFKQDIPTASPDQALTTLLEKLADAENKRAVLEPDYSPDHPEVQKVNRLLETLNEQVDSRLNGILGGLETRAKALENGVKHITETYEKARRENIENAKIYRPFVVAKEDLDYAKKLKEGLSLRVASELINLKTPYSSVVKIVDPAEKGMFPVSPRKVLNISLGVIVGLVLGIGLAFFIEYLDTSVKTIDDVERAMQSPVLGVIPQNVKCLIDEGPENSHAEAYRVLRTNILFSRTDESQNTFTVVSAGAGEGKSTTLFNLALIFAQNGHRVLVVDSDLRRPSVHKMLRVSNSIGLTNYLLKQNTLEEVIQTTSVPTLDFMPSGKLPSSSMGILSSSRMKEMVTELKHRYDFVFFDSPPIMGVSDASVIASLVDISIQVIQYRRYPQTMTLRAKQLIEKVGGNLAGIVLNNISMSADASYYYYGGYYHDYYGRNDDDQIVKPPADSSKKSGGSEKSDVEIKQKY